MGKVFKIGLIVAAVAINFVPGVGQAISGALTAALSGTAVGAGGTFLAASIAGTLTAGIAMAGTVAGLSMGAKALGLGPKPPKASPASQDRLRASIDPRAYRKIVFGHTAAAVDVGYQEFTGSDQEYLNSVVVLASHEIESIDEIWFDEGQAWTSGGGIDSDYTGYLSVTTREVGTAANAFTITGSTSWTSGASRMVGCAYLWLRYKLTGNSKKAESPFASTVTSRITVRVKGALLYDPRLDTTVGGSGAHRADDQTTWAWVSDDVGRNPALQLLWYLLGWRIQNPADSSWKLAVGLGLPVERIDLASFIAAANLCDEPVTLAVGGTEPRYRSDGVFSEGDDPQLVFENLLAAMNGVLRDAGGKLALEVLHNDLASPVVDLTEADVVGEFSWLQTPPVDQEFNVVRGRYVDSSDAGLYQFADYPDVTLASEDGIERPRPFDLPLVQSAGQAQRIAKQFLQRAQYPGTFAADFLASAWQCEVGSVVTLTFPALGFDEKLFRVVEHGIRFDGTCPMVLREEDAAIYAWDADESAPVSPAGAVSYDPLNDPFVQALAAFDQAIIRTAKVKNPRTTGDVPRSLLIASDVGSTATISVARHDWDYPVGTPDVTRELGTVTGLSFSTLYWIYFDDLTLAAGTVTYQATTDFDTALNSYTNPGRHFLGGITTPPNGGAPTESDGVIDLGQTGPSLYAGLEYLDGTVANTVNNINTDNDVNGLIPDAPTSVSISSTLMPDSTARLTVSWSFTPSSSPSNKNSIDGFLVGLKSRAIGSGGYTYSHSDRNNAFRWILVRPDVTGQEFEVPVDREYTAVVIAFRKVMTNVNALGEVLGSVGQSSSTTPHNPASSPLFTGKLGGGTDASTVELYSTYANAGLNSDGTVKTNKVDTNAIITGALNEADWEVQGGTIAISSSFGNWEQTYLTVAHESGADLVVQLLLHYQVDILDPDLGDAVAFRIRLLAQKQTGGTKYWSDDGSYDPFEPNEVWQGASASGVYSFSRKTALFEHTFTGLAADNYDIGFRAEYYTADGVALIPYRYIRAEDRRAFE